MRGIYWSDASHSDKCRYNCHLHRRCAAAYESQNLRCTWEVLWWMFDHDWYQKWCSCTNQETDWKCLLMHCYSHSVNLAVGVLKERQNSPEKNRIFVTNERDFHVYDMDSPTRKFSAQQCWLSEQHLWVVFWRTMEFWWSCVDGHKTMSATLTWRQE